MQRFLVRVYDNKRRSSKDRQPLYKYEVVGTDRVSVKEREMKRNGYTGTLATLHVRPIPPKR